MIEVSHADRVVFPALGRTKGDVVAYYERIAPRLLPHVEGRPLSMKRYPKGLSGPGFFQKNVPAHYPGTIGHFEVPRSKDASKRHARRAGEKIADVTVYPVLFAQAHIPYLANQGAIELHVPTSRATESFRPDRIVIDLDPPAGRHQDAQRAAAFVRDALGELGLSTGLLATGLKGYHVIASIVPSADGEAVAVAAQKVAALLAARHPDTLTIAFRTALRGARVFLDWLRNNPGATTVTPYSLRATPRATVATPLRWNELDTTRPDAFGIDDVARLLDRPDPLQELAKSPGDPGPFLAAVDDAWERSGLVLETFDRFRS